MPLCFYDADTNNTLTLYKDDSSISTNKITGSNSDGTYPAATAAAPNKVNVSYTFPQTFNTEQRKDFFILDNNSGQAGSSFRLTLLPATIGMTVSTSTAGYNYNAVGTAITGSYNDTILPYIGPYQLKYGEQLNFSCDKTTRYGIYSDNKVGFTFTTDLTSANNYTGTTYHRFDQGDSYYTNDTSIRSSLPYSTSALICVNINADNNLTTGNEKNRCLYVFICFY